MTIDLYPEIIRQEDLSPDSGFGGDIDEDCQVRQRVVAVMFCRKRSGLLIFVCFCCCPFFLSYFFFFFCSSNTKHTHTHTHKVIHDATKGWGANAQKVIDSLATKDASDRYMLSKRYEELFESKLVDIMKKEFRGDFGLAMEFLAMPLHEAECYMIKKATEGIGASIKILYCTLCFLFFVVVIVAAAAAALLVVLVIHLSIHVSIHTNTHTYVYQWWLTLSAFFQL